MSDRDYHKSRSFDKSRDSDTSRSSDRSGGRAKPASKDSDKSRGSDRSRSSPDRSRDSPGRSRDSPGRSRGSPRPVPRQSTSNVPVNPKPFINSLTGQEVNVKLKWGMEYRGILECADTYMNLQLSDAEEYIQHEKKSTMKTLLIRCNNILYVHKFDREAFEEKERRLAAEKAQNNNTEE